MEENSTKSDMDGTPLFAGEAWFDPIEAGIRDRVRGFIQELLEPAWCMDRLVGAAKLVRVEARLLS